MPLGAGPTFWAWTPCQVLLSFITERSDLGASRTPGGRVHPLRSGQRPTDQPVCSLSVLGSRWLQQRSPGAKFRDPQSLPSKHTGFMSPGVWALVSKSQRGTACPGIFKLRLLRPTAHSPGAPARLRPHQERFCPLCVLCSGGLYTLPCEERKRWVRTTQKSPKSSSAASVCSWDPRTTPRRLG